MISTKDITFSYHKDHIFHMPDVFCQAGNTLLVTGNSGKGKTTYLHILAGLLRPTSGQVTIDNIDITTLSEQQADAYRGKNIGVVFQKSHFIASLNVLENLEMASWLATGKKHTKRAKDLLHKLDVLDQATKLTTQLSLGQQQRVSIARALMNKPKVLLADEPTSSLDDQNAEKVIDLLENLAKEYQAALLIVTHDSRIKQRFTNQITMV